MLVDFLSMFDPYMRKIILAEYFSGMALQLLLVIAPTVRIMVLLKVNSSYSRSFKPNKLKYNLNNIFYITKPEY